MRPILRSAGPFLTVFLLALSLLPSAHSSVAGETVLEADRLKTTPEKTVARGQVRAKNPDWTIESDYLELNREEETRTIVARGNVSLTYSQWRITCNEVNLETSGGDKEILVNGEVVASHPDWSLRAGSLELTGGGEREVLVARGDVLLEGEDWEVGAGYLELESGDDKDGIYAREEVSMSAGDFLARSSDMRGTVGEDSRGRTLTGELAEVRGSTGSLDLLGEKATFTIKEGELQDFHLQADVSLAVNGEGRIGGDEVHLAGTDEGWDLRIEGNATYVKGDTLVGAKAIGGKLKQGATGEFGLRDATADSLRGELSVKLEGGEEKKLRIFGGGASFAFDDGDEISRLDLTGGAFSTCEGPEGANGCAYSISAAQTSLIDREIVLADSALLKSFGLPVGWSPLYFLSLKDVGLPPRNYFPRLGFSVSDGLSISGAVPVYVDRNNFGNVVLDYFSRGQGLGVGVDYYSGEGVLPGLAQVYGIYRLFGDNYFQLEADLSSKLTDRVDFGATVDFNRGTFQGSTYDDNEWSLSLSSSGPVPSWGLTIAREESLTVDEAGLPVDHAVERLPELNLEWEVPSDNIPGEYEVGGLLGYYREETSSWEVDRGAGRATLRGNFSGDTSPVGGLHLSWKGEGEVSYYLDPDGEDSRPRAWEEIRPSLKLTGPATLTAEFTHREKAGGSPFTFDRVDRLNRLSIDLTGGQGGVSQGLDFHYDFLPTDGFSDIKYRVNFPVDRLDQTVKLTYDPDLGGPESIGAESAFSTEGLGVDLATGYDFTDLSATYSSLGLRLGSGSNELKVTLEGTPFETWLDVLSGELSLDLFETWRVNVGGKYDLESGGLTSLSYSVYNTLQNCLRVGISGDESGVWFDVELAGL